MARSSISAGAPAGSSIDSGRGGCQRIAAAHSAVEIAQRADALLEVGLEQVQRRAEPIVAAALLDGERRDQLVRVAAGRERGQRRAHELDGQPPIAGDVARVEQRGRGGEVVLREPGRRARLAQRVADRELLVPQRIEQPIAQRLGAALVAVVQQDEVDVGVRRELAARPAAGRHERDALARIAPRRARGDEPLGERAIVDGGQIAADAVALPRLAQLPGDRRERRVEQAAQARLGRCGVRHPPSVREAARIVRGAGHRGPPGASRRRASQHRRAGAA